MKIIVKKNQTGCEIGKITAKKRRNAKKKE
jgi:hypothetical protein